MTGVVKKPLRLGRPIKKPAATPQESSSTGETEAQRQLRLAKKVKAGASSYEAKLQAFNARLAQTSDFKDIPKMKG